MTKERYKFLMSMEGQTTTLTPEEVKEGWHFCDEMDGLLANSNEADGDCYCHLNKTRNS